MQILKFGVIVVAKNLNYYIECIAKCLIRFTYLRRQVNDRGCVMAGGAFCRDIIRRCPR